jgi:hypothetical protein
LNRVNPLRTCNPGAFRIEFNAMPPNLSASGEIAKSVALTHARIDYGRGLGVGKQRAELYGFVFGERVVAHFDPGGVAHRDLLQGCYVAL